MRDARLLQAFFARLESDGLRIGVADQTRMRALFATRHQWDLRTVRVALRSLLTHDPHQRESFDRQFNVFFPTKDDQPTIPADQLRRVLDDLRNLQPVEPQPRQVKRPRDRPTVAAENPPPHNWRKRVWGFFRSPAFQMACLLAVAVGVLVWAVYDRPENGANPPNTPAQDTMRDEHVVIVETPPPPWTPDPWQDLAAGERLVISTTPFESNRSWIGWLSAGLVCLAGGGGYYAWLNRRRRLDLRPIAQPRLDASGKGFSIASIGGTRQPVLRQARTRRLADMLGQVLTDEFTHRLDLPRTIERTIRAGGFPDFAWQPDKITRRVLILEDESVDPDYRTGLIDDLQQGLERTGVEVERAWFRNGVNRFASARGVGRELRELHAWRQLYVVLVYTDGSGLARPADRQTLVPLTEWPAVALLDPRSPDRRGAAADPLADVPLARFRADEEGVSRAFRSFVDQRHTGAVGERQASEPARRTRQILSSDPVRRLASALGDSLLWAADCVWLQPCSLALAEALRERFHPHLPTSRLQRILDLPDTRSDPDGFRFGSRTRNALRNTWKRRRSEEDRQEVLDFIDDQLAEAEPDDRQSMSHLVWEVIRERFLLGADPRHSPRRLAELADSAVSPYVQESLHDFRVGRGPADDDRTVLETECDDPKSQQFLASMSDNLDIPYYSRLPLKRSQKGILSACATAATVCLLGLLWTLSNPHRVYWEIAHRPEGEYELREVNADGENVSVRIWEQDWTATHPVPSDGRTYQVVYRDQQNELETSPFDYVSGHVVSISATKETVPSEPQPAWKEFALIPPGTFQMGSPGTGPGRIANEQQHSVTLTRDFWLAATEVTQRQYQEVMRNDPSRFKQAPVDAPVENVSWENARDFCKALTKRERAAKRLPVEWEYRLPTEAQWEYACRAGSQTVYSFGDEQEQLGKHAWYHDNAGRRTHRVATKDANAHGLYDMHGNVWEWCHDRYDTYGTSPEFDPTGPDSGRIRVFRGGGWNVIAQVCRSAYRDWLTPEARFNFLGFRVAAVRVELQHEPQLASPRDEGERAIETFGELEFVKLPPGEFMMGSPDNEVGRGTYEKQHRVKISNAFYLARYEVTQQQWQEVMETSLRERARSEVGGIRGEGENFPMYHVSWNEAIEFCKKLTQRHQRQELIPSGYVYTLPTEAQWEYACRGGSQSAYSFGDDPDQLDEYAWYRDNADGTTHTVATKEANAFGLHDMHGNVWEWCWDWYATYEEVDPVIDPSGPGSGRERGIRGGGWFNRAQDCSSASRVRHTPEYRNSLLGFRVAAVRDFELQARRGR